MKIKINREIEIPDSLFCGRCRALAEYDAETEDYRAAHCKNFNSKAFADKNSGWAFVKCRECIDATWRYLIGVGRNDG